MISRRPSGPKRLTQGIDRDVYQVVRKLDGEDSRAPRLSVSEVYNEIARSNSSLARHKKRLLEESIDRVLAVRREERQVDEEDEDSEDVPEASDARSGRPDDRGDSILNKQLVKHWDFAAAGRSDAKSGGAVNGGVAAAERRADGEPKTKKRKADGKARGAVDRSPPTDVSIQDIAGLGSVLRELYERVWLPLCWGGQSAGLDFRLDNSVLLHGPSGCGKTMLANAVAAEVGVSYIAVEASTLVSGTSGESEKNIRDLFDEAIRLAPCLVFIDEVDVVFGPKESAQKAMEGRMVSEMKVGMDRVAQKSTDNRNIVVLAATDRPDKLDPAVRRRFGTEIEVPMPHELAREKILRAMTRTLPLADDVDFEALAKLTPGYVGTDLKQVVTFALMDTFYSSSEQSLQRVPSYRTWDGEPTDGERIWVAARELRHTQAPKPDPITFDDFKRAIAKVQPASKREGFSSIPDTTWSDVGALTDVRKRLEMSIIMPIKEPKLFASVGIKAAAGILLWGPPGCGKTLVAKAVANESKANFISIGGPELLNKYVGESERAVRQLFSRAKTSAPCILFFDEMDALVPRRDDSLNDASARVVNTLLTELDGVGDRSGIYVIGATNRPDIIDPAIRRPGRLGTAIYVGLPSVGDRADILMTIYRNTICGGTPLGMEMTARLASIARDRRCEGFSGADLSNLMQSAAQACLGRRYADPAAADTAITAEDWEQALQEVKPSVTDMHRYDEFST